MRRPGWPTVFFNPGWIGLSHPYVPYKVWRAREEGLHRNVLYRRTDLTLVELRSLLIRLGHALGRFQRERGLALPRPVAANSPLQSYFVDPDFAAVASDLFGERMPDQLSSGLRAA